MRMVLSRNEAILLAAFAALFALALFGPVLAQPPHAHDFADQRVLWGIPHAFDVLSNLPFAIAGCWGLAALKQAADSTQFRAQQACARLSFIGLLLTAIGSSVYHFAPDDLGLTLDRGAMGVAFAGLLGMAAARVSDRAGTWLAACLLAPASVAAWFAGGNVLPRIHDRWPPAAWPARRRAAPRSSERAVTAGVAALASAGQRQNARQTAALAACVA